MGTSSFCIGGAMIMGGNGLQLTGADQDGDCMMLWTDAFTVNSALRAVMANLCVALLAILAQFLTTTSANRMQRAKHYAKMKRESIHLKMGLENGHPTEHYDAVVAHQSLNSGGGGDSDDALARARALPMVSNWEHWSDSVQHGFRILVAYLLMLAAMTYDIAIISSIVVGFMVGYYLFTKDSTKVPESADPCCS